mmetsp:Transcript_6360/g.12671  ORF Transcript_6360/g.12671 Transcript_6360/m.12671 type:complete len:281 (+) Transcript_6360:920-1762(+)
MMLFALAAAPSPHWHHQPPTRSLHHFRELLPYPRATVQIDRNDRRTEGQERGRRPDSSAGPQHDEGVVPSAGVPALSTCYEIHSKARGGNTGGFYHTGALPRFELLYERRSRERLACIRHVQRQASTGPRAPPVEFKSLQEAGTRVRHSLAEREGLAVLLDEAEAAGEVVHATPGHRQCGLRALRCGFDMIEKVTGVVEAPASLLPECGLLLTVATRSLIGREKCFNSRGRRRCKRHVLMPSVATGLRRVKRPANSGFDPALGLGGGLARRGCHRREWVF